MNRQKKTIKTSKPIKKTTNKKVTKKQQRQPKRSIQTQSNQATPLPILRQQLPPVSKFPLKKQSTGLTSFSNRTPFIQSTSFFSSEPDLTIPNGCSDPKVTEAFELLNKGLKPMLSNNSYTITTEKDVYELDLGRDMGVYHWERDPSESFTLKTHRHAVAPIIYMSSPVSGTVHKYYFDSKRLEQWVSVDDEHYMVELLTRELLKSCYGYPDF